jgi:hypothetical protein
LVNAFLKVPSLALFGISIVKSVRDKYANLISWRATPVKSDGPSTKAWWSIGKVHFHFCRKHQQQ